MSKADLASNALAIGAHIAMQVSAKTGDKVEKLFTDLGIELIKRDSSVSTSTSMLIDENLGEQTHIINWLERRYW